MKRIHKARAFLILVFAAVGANISVVHAATYQSLENVQGLNIAYDFRLTDPQTAALFLQLIHETWLDEDVKGMEEPANFVVVINGGAVRLIAENQVGYSAEDKVYLEAIENRIADMVEDGIRFEGCLKAAEIFGVDHDRFFAGIHKINNAWISIAGYQAQRYAALPIN